MNKYEQQILYNQAAIMSALSCLMVNNINYLTEPTIDQMTSCVEATAELLGEKM